MRVFVRRRAARERLMRVQFVFALFSHWSFRSVMLRYNAVAMIEVNP